MYYKKDPRRNASGYVDTTAYDAIKNVDKGEAKYNSFLRELNKLLKKYDYSICNRLIIADLKNKKIWR